MDVKNNILKVSTDLFFSHGIQNISIEDIAKHCGVNSKSIYKEFGSKSELLNQTIAQQIEGLLLQLDKSSSQAKNALEALHSLFKYVNGVSCLISPIYGRELKKFYPNKYMEVFGIKNEIVIPFILRNIEKGKTEGLYKSDINTTEMCESFNTMAKVVFTSSQAVNSETNYNAIQFFNSLFIHRLVTARGLVILNRLNQG
ncbi:TetR family transcriptional regulator [Roseivirga ehrenbergii]|uniref:HTH tetR-type domain-containing protein n=1 Tax=Roseivirga ehrenbergii (strain DSM 102268 / JCM 13514 / KCTC 12282 / NCIMB 14502 / KMM 6017) TaxID=279360 RepID=A0A150X7U7_ROSEK|nr:TetR/AcrR family transcriptional regulator [Roseivirga ehrenbergii]KYG74805.1 hypothetical protein MB14_06265 [Roseivirga ehrenbergii]TCL13862.1 TetR family transcriptional regulator [Roseivirga ehrenbergii]